MKQFDFGSARKLYQRAIHPRVMLGPTDLVRLRQRTRAGEGRRLLLALRKKTRPFVQRILANDDWREILQHGELFWPKHHEGFLWALPDMALAGILDGRQVHVARRKLGEWTRWAKRSRLAPFGRLANTIRDHQGGILAYVRSRLSNARTEALNGKARTITRRAYGLHSASALIALLRLCCSGIHLAPVTLRPGSTH